MKCYFCQTDNHMRSEFVDCYQCMEKYNLHMVATYYKDCDKLLFTHIYVDYDNGSRYHVRMHLKENFTNIACFIYLNNNAFSLSLKWSNDLIKVPGFPITPQNVRDKLKLYLLFS